MSIVNDNEIHVFNKTTNSYDVFNFWHNGNQYYVGRIYIKNVRSGMVFFIDKEIDTHPSNLIESKLPGNIVPIMTLKNDVSTNFVSFLKVYQGRYFIDFLKGDNTPEEKSLYIDKLFSILESRHWSDDTKLELIDIFMTDEGELIIFPTHGKTKRKHGEDLTTLGVKALFAAQICEILDISFKSAQKYRALDSENEHNVNEHNVNEPDPSAGDLSDIIDNGDFDYEEDLPRDYYGTIISAISTRKRYTIQDQELMDEIRLVLYEHEEALATSTHVESSANHSDSVCLKNVLFRALYAYISSI